MARMVRKLIARKYNDTANDLSTVQAVAVSERAIDLASSAQKDAADAMTSLNCQLGEQQAVALSTISLRQNPRGFWASAHDQALRRKAVWDDFRARIQADKLLSLLPVPQLLLVLAEGNSQLGLKDFLGKG